MDSMDEMYSVLSFVFRSMVSFFSKVIYECLLLI